MNSDQPQQHTDDVASALKVAPYKRDPRGRRYGWAPGAYLNTCPCCHDRYIGDKLASLCADCAYALPDPTPTPAPEDGGTPRTDTVWNDIRSIEHGKNPGAASMCGHAKTIERELNVALRENTRLQQQSNDLNAAWEKSSAGYRAEIAGLKEKYERLDRLSNGLYRDLRNRTIPEQDGTGMIDEVRFLMISRNGLAEDNVLMREQLAQLQSAVASLRAALEQIKDGSSIKGYESGDSGIHSFASEVLSSHPAPAMVPVEDVKKLDYDKMIDCAAIKTSDGRVWTGKRHHHVIATIIQATGKKPHDSIQGFVTMLRDDDYPQGRFITREDAFRRAHETGQITKFCHESQLFSEDLY